MKYDTNFAVAIDFDGTIATNNVLDINAKKAIEEIKKTGCVIILWTCREAERLEETIKLLNDWGISFDYINSYPLRESKIKVNADAYIDDKGTIGNKIDWNAWVKFIKEEMGRRNVQNKKTIRN